MYKNSWDEKVLAKFGRESIDWMSGILNDESTVQRIRDNVDNTFGKVKHTITMLLPGISKMCLEENWIEVVEALKEISALDNDFRIFLRIRNYHEAKTHPHLKKILEMADGKKIILSREDYTTQELMAISDLVVTAAASFAINEAMLTKAKVFTFDCVGTAKLYFGNYGKDFVMTKRDDLVRAVKGLETNFESTDCAWESLFKDLNYYSDGKNCERYRKMVLSV